MAFDITKLALLGGANGFSLWQYRHTDPLSTIVANGYFAGDALNMMGSRDIILIEGKDAGGRYLVQRTAAEVSLDKISEWTYEYGKVYLPIFVSQTPLLAGTSRFVVTPVAGHVTGLTVVVRSAVTTGGVLTVELGGTAVDGISITVADGAVAGTVYTAKPYLAKTANNRVAARAGIELVGDAAFATAGDIVEIVEITPDEPSNKNVFLPFFVDQTPLLAGTSQWLVSPVAGQISRLTTITVDDVTTGGAITVELATAAVTGLSVTVGNAGGVGDIDTDTPTSVASSTGTVAAGDDIEIVIASAFETAGSVYGVLEITPTEQPGKVYLEDLVDSTDLLAGTSHWVAAPIDGYLSKVWSVTNIDVTTGGAITIELGGVPIPGLSVVVGDAGGVGDVDSDTPTNSADVFNAVTKGDPIEIVSAAAFASAGEVRVLLEFTPV